MARYTESVCRLCRREGEKLYLKGDRCYGDKCSFVKRSYAPGQHGQSAARKKRSEYGLQLREKQKARRVYGILEKQFHMYYVKAARMGGVTGENLLVLLETRLDNVVYRAGMAHSRAEARQLILHGHFTVNGKKVDIPSYLIKQGDEVAVAAKSKKSAKFAVISELAAVKTLPQWITLDKEALIAKIIELPKREDVDIPIEERLIVEGYSR
ncbi:MAG: 30S ribosomal protein S4 [Clostridiales bacterium]